MTARQPRRILFALAIAFAAALGAAGFFAVRFAVHATYWSAHRLEPIEDWMWIGYVAHSHDIPPQILQEAIGLPVGQPDRRPLADIAKDQGRAFADVRADLERAIAADAAKRPHGEAAR
ncbi:hypothetical protein [Pseudorhizobium pelagicum]|uniref:hypothetical protein n=1 Tax=Pseudorhizobium pelagicum TaxID=1509405 RepID=UPI00068B8AB3|nr:hypothetical protein [Pseudorhizobium pelagicum]